MISLVSGQSISGNINDVASGNVGALPSPVSAGNLLIINLSMLISVAGGDLPVAGDFSLLSGTASLGTFVVDGTAYNNYDAGDSYVNTAIVSVPVLGSGTCTIGIVTGTGHYTFATVEEFTGIDVSVSRVAGTNGGPNGFNAGSTAPSSGNATLTGGGLFYGGLCYTLGSNTTITPDGAFTQVYENESNSNNTGSVIRRIVTSGATDSADWTLGSSAPWAALVVAYKEATGGGPATELMAQACY